MCLIFYFIFYLFTLLVKVKFTKVMICPYTCPPDPSQTELQKKEGWILVLKWTSHLLHMDDIKLSLKDERDTDSLICLTGVSRTGQQNVIQTGEMGLNVCMRGKVKTRYFRASRFRATNR